MALAKRNAALGTRMQLFLLDSSIEDKSVCFCHDNACVTVIFTRKTTMYAYVGTKVFNSF